MPYQLGIDLGTTFTAAAIFRDGRVQTSSLGNRSASIPSVLFLREDGDFLVGDAADRRAVIEPERVAREFKRRLGDSTPIIVGGTPYAAEGLMAKLLRWVVDAVTEVEGEAPDHIGITHPANWGPYKTDLLQQAARMADIGDVTFLTEPEAAAIYYASNERVEPGTVIAAYDLGGGTFDAAVLEKTETGFKILGVPEGIERLGGVDFDHAVFAHVNRALDGALEELDPADDNDVAALGRLRHDCVEAKEGLSTDTDVSIPVMLPKLQTQVRLTRQEFEAMVRPTLAETMQALGRALRSAGVTADRVSKVLLVGGSSRIPLVGQMVSAELGRPVAVDAHPKYAIAHGAALAAQGFERDKTATVPVANVQPEPVAPPQPVEPEPQPAPQEVSVMSDGEDLNQTSQEPEPTPEPKPVVEETAPTPAPPPPPPAPPSKPKSAPLPVPLVVGGAVLGAVILIVVGLFMLDDGGNGSQDASTQTTDSIVPLTTAAGPTTTPTSVFTGPPPGVSQFAWIDGITMRNESYVVEFRTWGFQPTIAHDSKHVHFFFDTVTVANAGAPGKGPWQIYPTREGQTGTSPFTLLGVDDAPAGAKRMCVLVANHDHSVIPNTGNCVDLP